MKKMFILLPAFVALQASSQVPYYDFKKFKEDQKRNWVMLLDKTMPTDSLQKVLDEFQQMQMTPSIGNLIYTQTNGTKVYALTQDNMVCLVPDLSRHNYNMPIAGTGIKITGMPPGSIPNTIIPRNNNKKPLR
jgi:hypothetical protein